MKKRSRKHALANIPSVYTVDEILAGKEEARVQQNEAELDRYLENLAEYIGRKLTTYEEDEVLDIVDKYTPADEKDNYLVDLIPFEYVWEIYKAKKEIEWKKYNIPW